MFCHPLWKPQIFAKFSAVATWFDPGAWGEIYPPPGAAPQTCHAVAIVRLKVQGVNLCRWR